MPAVRFGRDLQAVRKFPIFYIIIKTSWDYNSYLVIFVLLRRDPFYGILLKAVVMHRFM